MLLNLKEHPEFAIRGMKVKVEMDSKWIGAQTDEPTVLCPGYITKVVYDDDSNIIGIYTNIVVSPKHKNSSVKNMLSLKEQIETIFVDAYDIKIFGPDEVR